MIVDPANPWGVIGEEKREEKGEEARPTLQVSHKEGKRGWKKKEGPANPAGVPKRRECKGGGRREEGWAVGP